MTRLATVINKIIDIINTKQPTLVSGENIKKLNGTDIVGSGNIPVKTVGGESILGDGNVGVKTINGETMIGSGDAEIVGTGTLSTTAQNIIGAINELDTDKAEQSDLTALTGRVGTAETDIVALDGRVTQAEAAVGTPLVASTVANMTDITKIYVYTGSETGYTSGNWYYWNGTAWTSGGVYNSTAFQTDTTLAVSGMAADAKVVGDELTDVKSALTTIAMFRENRFDKSGVDTIVGKYVKGDGTYTDDPQYFVSNYIVVSKGDVVNATESFGSSYYGGCLYDENMNALGRLQLSNNTYTVNNDNAAYIRLNGLSAYINSGMVSINLPIPDTYTPYGRYAYQAATFFLSDSVANPLYGKRALFNGDSICYGEGFSGGYPLMIANDNNMDIVNYAVSGATITADTLTTTHWICRSISAMSDDADYIILEGGVNDPNTDNIGSITSGFDAVLDDTTFCGAFESMLKQAILKWKGKKIGFILSPKAYSYDGSGADKTKWDNARAICEKWSVPYLDLRNMSGLTAGLSDINQMFFKNGDGVHPNEAGYKVIVPRIEAWMKTL